MSSTDDTKQPPNTADATQSTPRGAFPTRFSRTVDLYGEAGFARIRAAYVAVIGLGGVGSHCAVSLARSGVGRLLVVDFDTVTESSLNRSPVAGPGDVGQLKAVVLAAHLRNMCPDTQVIPSQEFCHLETLPALLRPNTDAAPDLNIDAIDSLNPKVTLLEYCVREELAVLSSMGAAGRRDPTRMRVAELAETRVCPLAREVRRRLKRRWISGRIDGDQSGAITCVFSDEPPAPPRPPDLDDRTCERGRVRNRLASQMSLPGIFGYTLAALALDRLAAD